MSKPKDLYERAMAEYDKHDPHSVAIEAVISLVWVEAGKVRLDVGAIARRAYQRGQEDERALTQLLGMEKADFRPSDGPHQHRASCDDAGGNHMRGHQ